MNAAPNPLEPSDLPVVDQLTRRERDVLVLIGTGMSNLEMADELHLSVNSVKTHVRTAYRRVGITRRAQAVVWSVQHRGRLAALDAAVQGPARTTALLPALAGHAAVAAQAVERARLRRVNGL